MSFYQKLIQQLNSNKISIRIIISLFRSHSTALAIALSQSDEITAQISEPFVHDDLVGRSFNYDPSSEKNYRPFDRGCENITLASQSNDHESILVKEMSAHLIKPEFEMLIPLASHFIFTIRDPKLQVLSLLTRLANDILSEKFGDNLSVSNILRLYDQGVTVIDKRTILLMGNDEIRVKQILSFIDRSQETVLSDEDITLACQKVLNITTTIATIAWNNLFQITNLLRENQHRNYIIIDGSELLQDPKSLLQLVTSAIKLEFNESMIKEWRKATGKSYQSSVGPLLKEKAQTNSWTGPAIQSKFFKQQEKSVPNTIILSTLPTSLQSLIDTLNKDYYQPLRADPNFITSQTRENLINQVQEDILPTPL